MAPKITITLRGTKIRVDDVWDQYRAGIGHNGYDVACYINDGVSIWPCGETVDAKENTGEQHCTCRVCERVRALMPNDKLSHSAGDRDVASEKTL